MNGKYIANRLADIVVNSSAILDSFYNGGKIVIHQNEIGGFTRNLTATFAHGDAYVGIFECGCIIHAVTCHSNDFTVFFKCLDNPHFMLRYNPRKDAHVFDLFTELLIGHFTEHITGNDMVDIRHTDFLCNGGSRDAIIACNHNYTDTGFIADGNVGFYAFTWWISKTDESTERQATVSDLRRNFRFT